MALLPYSWTHGDAGELELVQLGCGEEGLQQGNSRTSSGRATATVLSQLPPLMVERRPLLPLPSATIFSGRRRQVVFNLQAVPRRPRCSSTACSRCIAPSGLVPSGDVVGRAAMLTGGGKGAGLDCFPQNLIRVICAKCKDLSVLVIFLLVLVVKCISTAEN